MALRKIYAQLGCSDLGASADWYRTLFARARDVEPMDGLMEWHHGEEGGFQLVLSPDAAGKGAMTLIVSDLAGERERLAGAGLETGEITRGDFASFMQLSDPDGNSVTLAEPG